MHKHIMMSTAIAAVALTGWGQSEVHAQGAVGALLDEITVVARKRSQAELIQDVPVAVTAFNADQLLALGFNDLTDLSYSIPNVSLDEIGTGRGIASFAIRGLTATSSIPSIDPAVATFVDGVYLPANAGTVTDSFDLEAIEVLRGPQGTLFGRNVTGGAVLLRTKRPGQEFEVEGLARVQTGIDYTLAGAVQGGITDTLSMRFAAYFRDDAGFFENIALQIDPTINGGNDKAGAIQTWFVRPSVLWEPTERLNMWLKYEHLRYDGDAPPGQNTSIFYDQNEFDVAVNNVGSNEFRGDSVTWETNFDIGPGTITNLFGWRFNRGVGGNDIDATPGNGFFSSSFTKTRTFSNETRYAGSVWDDRFNFTAGVFAYRSELDYMEQRLLAGFLFGEGGGRQTTNSLAAFTENQLYLTDKLSWIFGVRYSAERKRAELTEVAGENCAGLSTFPIELKDGFPPCSTTGLDSDSWFTLGAKVGFQYEPTDDILTYIQWTRGFRSGGFNVRDTAVDGLSPPSFDQEEMDVFEIGLKADWLDGRARTNVALFWNNAEDLQRDVQVDIGGGGVSSIVQTAQNTGKASIKGVEFEGRGRIFDNLLVTANLGYVDADYREILFDLTGDGVIDSADFASEFPRLAEFTYGGSIVWEQEVNFGVFSTSLTYDHRDPVFFTDDNDAEIFGADRLGARVNLSLMDGKVDIAAFGRNLLNHVVQNGATCSTSNTAIPQGPQGSFASLPDSGFRAGRVTPGQACFSPIQKGRVLGFEISVKY